MNNPDPVLVRYVADHAYPASIDRHHRIAIVSGPLYDTPFSLLKESIDAGRVNLVVIVGKQNATGWRIKTARQVRFLWREPQDTDDEIAQKQASERIHHVEAY